jgi:GntR family transcriptional regulator/MocR family aminotransferase
LSPARRHALTGWARRSGGYVIEDDYDSEFRYDKEPVGALQGLAPDQIFLLGTASKALAPAVRLGWVHAPAPLAGAVAAEKQMSDRGSCTLDQLALATLLTTGRYDRHLRRMRTRYAARRTALTNAFARHVPRVQLAGLAPRRHPRWSWGSETSGSEPSNPPSPPSPTCSADQQATGQGPGTPGW